MKKFISLCLAAVLVCSMSITAFAESYGTTSNTIPYYWYSSATINGKIYSSCTVTIPETIEAGEGYYGSVDISNADVESGYEIVISITNLSENNTILLNNESNCKTVGCSIYADGNRTSLTRDNNVMARFEDEVFDCNTEAHVSFQALITDSIGAKAGTYSGIIEFDVRIDPYQ